MHGPDDEDRKQQIWKSLSDAGLVEISPEEFPDRIKEAKHTVMGRLNELLKLQNDVEERQSLAHSLGTLSNLELTFREHGSPLRKK